MLSVIHYISAIRRLEEIEKTILMMGGSRHHDEDVPVTLVAQRDMVKREIEYYKDRCEALAFYTVITLVFVSVGVTYWKVFHG
jgi:alpha-galactosidase